jgi:hypothetical protein
MNTEERLFYIVSLKHTSKGDTALTFWGKDGAGYTWHRDRAGLYNQEEARSYSSTDNVPVPREDVDKWWMNAQDFGDKYVSVPNNPTILQIFGLSDKFMKPKKYKSCKMIFNNEPVTN